MDILLADGKRSLQLPDDTNDATKELSLFWVEEPPNKFIHLAKSIDLLFNSQQPDCYIWNDWTQWMQETFSSEETFITLTGGGATWKTTSAAIYCLTSWYASPRDTVVICTSTTLPGLRRRIWKEIMRYWRIQPCMGFPSSSDYCIRNIKGSDDSGIFGVACETGDINRAVGKIQGFHAANIIVVVDEMPYTAEAAVEVCTNLRTACKSFKFIGIGNADDRLDPHGRYCEPVNSWDSISAETKEWKTRRGVCLHLDCYDSPNVKAGKILFPGLLNQQDIDQTIHDYGEDSPQFWSQRRGFWAPESMSRTVLSAPLLTKFGAMKPIVWNTDYTAGAALDPAFEGGDRCILRIGHVGVDMDGKWCMSLREIIQIKTKADPNDPIHYQIMRQVREACIERNIPPKMFALDSTGEGGGLASIFQREWSMEILLVEFGGRASDDPISPTNPKPAREEYFNKVTELWYGFRNLVMNGQVRDLDHETAVEFCQRRVIQKGPLTQVEPKAIMKERTGRSPDLADSTVVLTKLFLTRFGDFRHVKADYMPDERWKKWCDNMSAEVEEEYYAHSGLDE